MATDSTPPAAPDESLVLSRVSSAKVREATGHGWPEWLEVLDAAGAQAWDHRQTVAYLAAEHPEVTAWWQQCVTVGYEQARGKREVGETADAGFEIGVRRTVAATTAQVWDVLTARPDLWLGAGAELTLEPGERYEVPPTAESDGARGEVRVVRPGERLRMTWQPGDWPGPATLQITLIPATTGTTVSVHLEKLPDGAVREAMRAHWRAVLAAVAGAVVA